MAIPLKRTQSFDIKLVDEDGHRLIKMMGGSRTGREDSKATTLSFLESTREGLHRAVEEDRMDIRQQSMFAEKWVRIGLENEFGYEFPPMPVKRLGEYVVGPKSRLSLKRQRELGLLPEEASNGNGHEQETEPVKPRRKRGRPRKSEAA